MCVFSPCHYISSIYNYLCNITYMCVCAMLCNIFNTLQRVFPLLHSSACCLRQNYKKKKKMREKIQRQLKWSEQKKRVIWWFLNHIQLFDNQRFFFPALNKQQKHVTRLRFNNVQWIAGQFKYFFNHAVENNCLNVNSLPVLCIFSLHI